MDCKNHVIEQVRAYMFVLFITISKQTKKKTISAYPTLAHKYKQLDFYVRVAREHK
jgi:2-oxo-4-hydroxy-4-carboxy--5-ureidoimidazoline (OHCU) decarboxylase